MSTIVKILKEVAKILLPIVKESVKKDTKCSNCGYEMSAQEAYKENLKHMSNIATKSAVAGVPRLISNKTNLPCPRCNKQKCWVDA